MASKVIELRSFDQRRDLNFNDDLTARNWLNERIAAGAESVFSEVATVYPAMARYLLERNAANRPLRVKKLRQYVRDIQSGSWSLNGEVIVISKDGMLSDGQHRLEAVIEANRPVQMILMFGIERDTRKTIDTGSNRRAQDFLAIEGVRQAPLLASAARLVIAMERGNMETFRETSDITTVEIIDRVLGDEAFEATGDFVATLRPRQMKAVVQPAIVGAAHYFFSKKAKVQAGEFLEAVCHGKGECGSVRAIIRDRLAFLDDYSRLKRMELLIRGWNAERDKLNNPRIPLMSSFPRII